MHAPRTEARCERAGARAVRRGPGDTGGMRNGIASEAPLGVVAEGLLGRPVVRSVFHEIDRWAYVSSARMATMHESARLRLTGDGPTLRVAVQCSRSTKRTSGACESGGLPVRATLPLSAAVQRMPRPGAGATRTAGVPLTPVRVLSATLNPRLVIFNFPTHHSHRS